MKKRNRKKRLVISSGDKGGTCKSTLASGAADVAVRHSWNVILADAETSSTQATATEIAVRSGYSPLSGNMEFPAFASWRFGDADGWMRFLNDIDRLDRDVLVVADSGAAQQGALEGVLPVLAEAREAGVLTASVLFATGRSSDSRAAAQSYLRALFKLPAELRPQSWFALVDPDGRPEEHFHVSDPAAKPDVLTLARAIEEDPEHVRKLYIGRFPACFFEPLFFERRTPAAVLADPGTPFGTRSMLSRWLRTVFDPMILPIIGTPEPAQEPEETDSEETA